MKESVQWIISSLEEVIEDMDEDESDVPILPLADFSIKAMDNSVFQSLLTVIGIKPPSDIQVSDSDEVLLQKSV